MGIIVSFYLCSDCQHFVYSNDGYCQKLKWHMDKDTRPMWEKPEEMCFELHNGDKAVS